MQNPDEGFAAPSRYEFSSSRCKQLSRKKIQRHELSLLVSYFYLATRNSAPRLNFTVLIQLFFLAFGIILMRNSRKHEFKTGKHESRALAERYNFLLSLLSSRCVRQSKSMWNIEFQIAGKLMCLSVIHS